MRQFTRSPQPRSNSGRSDNKRQESSRDSSRSTSRNGNNGGSRPNGNGNPRELHQKYLTLAREAATSGDVVEAEQYMQHAEHYYRVATERAANHVSPPYEQRRAPAIPEPVVQPIPQTTQATPSPDLDKQPEFPAFITT